MKDNKKERETRKVGGVIRVAQVEVKIVVSSASMTSASR